MPDTTFSKLLCWICQQNKKSVIRIFISKFWSEMIALTSISTGFLFEMNSSELYNWPLNPLSQLGTYIRNKEKSYSARNYTNPSELYVSGARIKKLTVRSIIHKMYVMVPCCTLWVRCTCLTYPLFYFENMIEWKYLSVKTRQ